MKSLLKFTLLSALIISGRLAKQTAPAAAAKTIETKTAPDTSMVFVNRITLLKPIKNGEEKNKGQQKNVALLYDMF